MDTDPTWIEDLLKNNRQPSQEEAQEIKRLLLEPSKELEDLDGQISNLRNRLSELERRRTETRKRMTRYELILSPLRRIPSDVLGEIFYHCLPVNRNPIMISSDCPLLLTRVSSAWREAAMTTPKLWDRLYITFTDEDTVPDLESLAEKARKGETVDGWHNAQSKADKQRTTELLRRRFEAVKEWVLRSGARPLSIALYLTAAPWYNIPYSERPASVTMDFLSFLASLAPRWKNFEVKSSMKIYRALEKLLPISEMEALTSLRAEYHPQYPEDEDAVRPSQLMNAPNLRQISMSVSDTKVWGLANRSPVQWHNLTHITCLNSFSAAETIFLLGHSSNLVHYKGIISEYGTENTTIFHKGPVFLPYLQSLSLTEYLMPRRVSNIYESIDAPKLERVTYYGQFSIEYYSTDNPAPMPILSLLRKCTELGYLSVDVSDFTVWDLVALLRAIPSVKDLIIGQATYLPMVNLGFSRDYTTSGLVNHPLWNFSDFIVSGSSDDYTPVLPQLTSLTISSSSMCINDDTLFDLVKSRMISGAAAALKHVKVVFPKEMTRNVSEELARYAELVGVEIDLNFSYAQAPAPTIKPTSPAFGLRLRDKERRSWPYVDAGEDE